MLALLDQEHPFIADAGQSAVAREAADRLKSVADVPEGAKVSFKIDESNVIVPLPAPALKMLQAVLEAMANRTPISLIPYNAELSTQQAADFLNVSRPYLVKRLELGELPYRTVGTHRRVRFDDLIAYERAAQVKQRQALAALHEEEKALDLE